MITKIKVFFDKYLVLDENQQALGKTQRLQLATAALLFEISKADYEMSDEELAKIKRLLAEKFSLSSNQLGELIQLAKLEVKQSTSLYDFTRLINDEYSLDDKKQIIYLLWQVAFADQVLDKYEEALIRKIAELIYVPHQDFIALKLQAQNSAN